MEICIMRRIATIIGDDSYVFGFVCVCVFRLSSSLWSSLQVPRHYSLLVLPDMIVLMFQSSGLFFRILSVL